uniref:Uncharacterized protein n=1 Tax=Talaromyces marneffei PM1 TaxID=1077442 RepID=A0A093UT74_TALMA
MPVIFAGNFDAKLREWARQPDLGLQGYELLPVTEKTSSIETRFIDGILWEKSHLRKHVDYVAGRFLQGGVEHRWIIPGNTMQDILGGKANLDRLNSALWELNVEKVRYLSVEIEQNGSGGFLGVTVSKLARCLVQSSSWLVTGLHQVQAVPGTLIGDSAVSETGKDHSTSCIISRVLLKRYTRTNSQSQTYKGGAVPQFPSRFILHIASFAKRLSKTAIISHFPYILFNMASSSHNSKAQAQFATPPDSPDQETPSRENKRDSQLIANAIRGLFADKKGDTSPTGRSYSNGSIRDKLERLLKSTEDEKSLAEPLKMQRPLDNGSEPVTVNMLIGLLEAALKPKGSLDLSATERAGAEQGGDITSHDLPLAVPGEAKNHPAGIQRLRELLSQLAQTEQSSSIEPEHRPVITVETSDSCGNLQACDAATEIDDSPQELYRFSWTGFDPRSVVTAPPNSPHVTASNFITREELKWLFAEVLGIKSAQPTSDGKDSSSNEKAEDIDRTRIRASKAEYKTVNEVWDSAKYEYKIINSAPVPDVNELDEYIFVIRKCSHKQTKELIVYVDIKSPGLRDILKEVLKYIRTANLDADRPAIERDLLYHYLDELRDR